MARTKSNNTKLYPRSVLKRIVHAHTKCKVTKNADVLLYLNYVLFIQHLMREAAIEAKKAGEKRLSPHHIRKVTEVALMKFRG